jgi:hypothetical protein
VRRTSLGQALALLANISLGCKGHARDEHSSLSQIFTRSKKVRPRKDFPALSNVLRLRHLSSAPQLGRLLALPVNIKKAG